MGILKRDYNIVYDEKAGKPIDIANTDAYPWLSPTETLFNPY
jgi:hypothetical protein